VNVSVEPDDVLLNITGDSVARCCQPDIHVLPARVNQHVAIIRTKKNELIPTYLKYFLVSPTMQAHMLGLAGAGATRNALTKGMIENFIIPVPTLPTQRAIAHILGSLDDKIELNRQMNETLESMAQALFKSWFVDFDPVIDNAIAAGNPIPEPLQARAAARKKLVGSRKPLPQNIQKQFPDRFVQTDELGWVPEGWKVNSVYESTVFINGSAFRSADFSDRADAYFTPGFPVLLRGRKGSSQPFVFSSRYFPCRQFA
jgi:type I restriction enzyme S subunit